MDFKNTCIYCGKSLLPKEGNNPEDYGLHTPYINFAGKSTCDVCNIVVTQTNRLLKGIIDSNGGAKEIIQLKGHVNMLSQLYWTNTEKNLSDIENIPGQMKIINTDMKMKEEK